MCDHAPELRTPAVYQAIGDVLASLHARPPSPIVHISLQRNHVHLLNEPEGPQALSALMQRFVSMAARAINAATRHIGPVFAHRYHARPITTKLGARNALSYVLNNWRRHEEDLRTPAAFGTLLDPYSSAISFTGWKERAHFDCPPGYQPLPVAAPRTALLSSGWKTYGLISCFEVPGPLR